MDAAYLQSAIAHLEAEGVRFESGLTDAEVRATQAHFGFVFPPDLRAFVQAAQASSARSDATPLNRFPNWRSNSEEELRFLLEGPLEGMCFDIEHNTFWNREWGTRPSSLEDAYAVAREAVSRAPKLIPVWDCRYLPDSPCQSGNPVLSVVQTDIIVYGNDLASYFEQEFKVPNPYLKPSEPRRTAFWSDLL